MDIIIIIINNNNNNKVSWQKSIYKIFKINLSLLVESKN